MWGLFKDIKRMFTGKIVNQVDLVINNGGIAISLRLIRNETDGDKYVTLKTTTAGMRFYCSFEPEEFNRFMDGAEIIQHDLNEDT